MVSMVTLVYILVSSVFGHFFLYPGKKNKKQIQSIFAKYTINSLARSAERHCCDIS